MEINCEYVSYSNTGYFTKLTNDYINEEERLKPFYNYSVSLQGIKEAIAARKNFSVNRDLLVTELRKQYKGIILTLKQERHLQSLLQENTFTICTAHQPVIFTGPLYFIYKIFHAIKLADMLAAQLTENNFVPVFYMGSEDADIDELGHIFLNGEKLSWTTDQSGAVGRMKVDKSLLQLIDTIAAQLEVEKEGKQLISLLKESYKEGITISEATLHLVNELFKEYGLLVIIPDNSALKKEFTGIIQKEIEEQFSHRLTEITGRKLAEHYKPQAQGRDINLFYLTDNSRERIEKEGDIFIVRAHSKQWKKDELLQETDRYPERFSANVILRPLFQEKILPDIVFIGGGGETAYWLELKSVFEAAGVFYPMLILRNSFLLINGKQKDRTQKLHFKLNDLFKSGDILLSELVKKNSTLQLSLSAEKEQLQELYSKLQNIAGTTDVTLRRHTEALQYNAIKKLDRLENKMLRAEKRKAVTEKAQIEKLKQTLFPGGSLQERKENFSLFYARHGQLFMQMVYESSSGLEQHFGVISTTG